MTKIYRTTVKILSAILTLSLLLGAITINVNPGANALAGEREISGIFADKDITDISGLVKTDTDKFFDPSVIYKLPDDVESEDEISVIVSMNGSASLMDRYCASEKAVSLNEYVASKEAAAIAGKSETERKKLLKKLDRSGIEYRVGEVYDTILSGFEITVKAGDFKKAGEALGNNVTLIVGEVYEPAATTEVITNEVDVYSTGIFNSAGSVYQGDGVVVAILDTGLDYTHTAFSVSNFSTSREKFTLDSAGNKIKVNPSNDPADIYSVNVSDTVAAKLSSGLTAQDVYMNKKVPYAYDYADKDPDVLPINSEHGTHVAGIIAGKDDVITGVAPNAQLAIMKVFSDTTTGAKSSWILAALEDCVKLGVDVINMSLGSACGFSRETDEEQVNKIYDSIKSAGISLITAAGNNNNATTASTKNGTNPLTSNPDSGTVGSPSTYNASLSVASVNGVRTPYLKYGNQIIYFNEAATSSGKYKNFVEDILKDTGADSKEFEYVTIPGIGRSSDYPNDEEFYRGKIVLIKRGITTFEEKVRIALIEKGAAGAIIYNNISGQISMQVGADIGAVCSISQDDGELLAAPETGKIIISRSNTAGPFMSDFSSWGPTSDLKIKPEITGHGGEIYSAVPGQSYDRLSGTSMACPNVAGATALIRQYVTYSGVFGNPTPQQITAYVNQLMMSTGDIIKNKNGIPASVRKQGAGLVNINKSVKTSAYITTFDKNGPMDKTKIEYGDDKEQKGEYTVVFDITNVTGKTVSYDVNSVLSTEGVGATYTGHDEQTSTQEGYLLAGTKTEVLSVTGGGSLSGSAVSVTPNGTAKVTVRLTLSDADKKYLKDHFANGMFVDGFITLTANSGASVSMNAPFLAFFGDWNVAPIFDEELYDTDKDDLNKGLDEVDKLMPDAYATRIIGGTYSDYIVTLGQYVFTQNPSSTQIAADRNKIAISNYEAGQGSAVTQIRNIYAGLLRNVKEWDLTITDDATGEVVFNKSGSNQRKSYSSGNVFPSSMEVDFKTLDHNLKNNAKYTVTVKAYNDYGTKEEQDAVNLRNVFEFPLYVDFEAPVVTDVTYSTTYDRTSKKTSYFAEISVYDNHYAMGFSLGQIRPATSGDYMFEMASFGKYVTPVISSYNSTSVVKVELTDYIESIKQSAGISYGSGRVDVVYNNNSYIVNVYDYALNEATYEIRLPDEILGIAFTEEEIRLSPNETKPVRDIIKAFPDDSWLSVLDYETSDPEVATVVNGTIIAKASGTAVITAKGKNSDVTAELTVKVLGEGDEGYNGRYSVIWTNKFALTGYETVKAFYSPSSSEREIGEIGNSRAFDEGTSVSMFPSEMIKVNYQLDSYYPDNTVVTYSVGNSRIASVTEEGVVTALAKGSTIVTVNVMYKENDDSPLKSSGYSARIAVTVKDPYVNQGMYLNAYKGLGGVVDIPGDKGITTINDYAFSLYEYVDKDLSAGDVIDKEDPYFIKPAPIGDGHYEEGWEKITKVIIPEGVTTINSYAFAKLTALEEVVLPKSLITIGLSAFAGCGKLKTVNLENVKFINEKAFSGCSIENADFSSVVAIGNYAFENCKLQNISLPVTSQSLGKGAFYNNKYLTSAEFKASKIKIGDNVFGGCASLYSVDINAAVIAANAFRGCSMLSSVKLGKDVTVIGEYAFAGTKVEKFTIDPANANLHAGEGGALVYRGNDVSDNGELVTVAPNYGGKFEGGIRVIKTDAVRIAKGAFAGNKAVSNIKANSALYIGDYAFSGCESLTSIELDTVSTIGDYAFENTKINRTPSFENVAEIGRYAFAKTSVTSVNIPDGTVIGSYAFADCADLRTVVIGNNVTVGDHAFFSTLDESIINDNGIGAYVSYVYTVKDEFGNDTGDRYDYYRLDINNAARSALTSVTIGEGAVLGAYSFSGNVRLNALTLGGGATIGDYAFYNDYRITSADLSEAVSVGAHAFSGIEAPDYKIVQEGGRNVLVNATEVYSEGGALYGGEYLYTAFAPSITEADLSSAVSLGEYAFAYNGKISSVTFGQEITTIPAYAFYKCVSLEEADLPDAVEEVGAGAFSLTSVESANLENVSSIGDHAFAYTPISQADFKEGAVIGAYAFYGCEKLTAVNGTEGIAGIGEMAFGYTSFEEADLTGAEHIGDFAFFRSAVKDVKLGEKLVKLGENPFIGCAIESFGKTADIEFNGKVVGKQFIEDYSVSDHVKVIGGALYEVVPYGLEFVSYPVARTDVNFVIADGTVRISARAFDGAPIANVTVPHTVKAIGDKAFYDCINLKTVTFLGYTAPVLEEEFDETYAYSGSNLPISGDYLDNVGLGISKYYMWNISSRTNNFYYGANFVGRIGHTDGSLVMVKPSNGQNYNSFILSRYFGTVLNGSPAANEQTLEVINLISTLPKPEDISLSDEARVIYVRSAYDKITSYEQKALVSNYSDLVKAESSIAYLKNEGGSNTPEPTPEKEPSAFGKFMKGNIFGFALTLVVAGGFVAYILITGKKNGVKGRKKSEEGNTDEQLSETAEAVEENADDEYSNK